MGGNAVVGFRGWGWFREQFTSLSEVSGSSGVSDDAVVPDAVEALWQDVDEESSDELAIGQCHGLVSEPVFGPVVFPLEGDAVLVMGDEAGV